MLMPMEKAPACALDLKPSRLLSAYIAVVHLGLLVSLAVYPMSVYLSIVAGLAILAHGGFSHRRCNDMRSPRWITRFEATASGFRVVTSQERRAVRLLEATVWQWLIVLRLRAVDGGQCYTLVVLPDSCCADQRRRLRVLLRHCTAAVPKPAAINTD